VFYSSGDVIPYQLLKQTGFRNLTVYRYSEPPFSSPDPKYAEKDARKQVGAKKAMLEPYLNKWFDGYDW
jgi:hypothetical protein